MTNAGIVNGKIYATLKNQNERTEMVIIKNGGLKLQKVKNIINSLYFI